LANYKKAIDYFGDEIEKYIPKILAGEIGRYALSKKTGESKHRCRTVIKIIKNTEGADKDAKEYKNILYDPEYLEVFAGLKEECDKEGIPLDSVKHFWHKSKNYSIFAKKDGGQSIFDKFESIVSNYIDKPFKEFKVTNDKSDIALKATKTDAHLGMNPNPNGDAIYQYEYGEAEYRQAHEKFYNSILKEYNTYGKFDVIYIDDLGDPADGLFGQTVRGGHDLPQNITEVDVFSIALDTNLSLVENLASKGISDKIVMRSIVNDNHSGIFGQMINVALKKIVNRSYDTKYVEVDILDKFIEHRIYGDHCYLITHGKDKEQMKRGLPLKLNEKTINYISDYIDFYELQKEAKWFHVEKGDLHQISYDKCFKFDYRNFMSLAPPSNYLQTNYGPGYSGYSIQVIPKHKNEISHSDYFIDYKKIK